MNTSSIKAAITRAFRQYTSPPPSAHFNPIPKSLTSGKLYEAFVLAKLARQLTVKEGLTLRLVAGKKLRLKSSPGPINRKFPHIDVYRSGIAVAEIWTDIEFLSLSYKKAATTSSPTHGQYHELDIVLIEPNQSERPQNDKLWLGVECKNTSYSKRLLKEILGVRRELSYWTGANIPTRFVKWPRSFVPAYPPSCLLVYSTDSRVQLYADPGIMFGIDFFHQPM